MTAGGKQSPDEPGSGHSVPLPGVCVPTTRYLVEGIELTRRWSEVGTLDGYVGLARVRQAQGDVGGAL